MPRRTKAMRRRAPKRPAISRKLIRSVVEGRKLKVNTDPPSISVSPWWPLTIIGGATKEQVYHPSDIWSEIKKQVTGIAGADSQQVTLRLLKVRIWCTKPVNLTISNEFGGQYNALHDFYDSPGRNQYARVGFAFGDVESQTVYDATDSKTSLFTVDPVGADSALVYIDVLIRCQSRSYASMRKLALPELSLSDMAIG